MPCQTSQPNILGVADAYKGEGGWGGSYEVLNVLIPQSAMHVPEQVIVLPFRFVEKYRMVWVF